MYTNIILIPYRNRKRHLDYFIEHSVPLIKEHLPNSKVVVIEQDGTELFNRGKILNVGFKEYQHDTQYFITHDVDINPTKLFVNEKYNSNVTDNEVLGLFTSVCNTLGGIIKLTSNTIFKINGFPNDCWGWGGEDMALQRRSEFYNIKKHTFLLNDKSDKSKYMLRFDDINDSQKMNNSKHVNEHSIKFSRMDHNEKLNHILNSGLNNIKYNIMERYYVQDIVELIKVKI
jgi:hypothetical protein